jgi:hypothetical protein
VRSSVTTIRDQCGGRAGVAVARNPRIEEPAPRSS